MPRVALSMIVRDCEVSLPACLESVRGLVDEIVVADTGSVDATPAVARQCGARVISIPWEQDFAKARNLALAETHADWVLMLDADEQLDPAAARLLPPLLREANVAGYLVSIRNYVRSLEERRWNRPARANDSDLEAARPYPAYLEHDNVRLFRRHPEIYFVGRVHETVRSRLLETGGKLGRAGFVIHHFGLAADAETRAAKNRLARELGRQKVRDLPEDGQAHFELGLVEFDNFHDYAEALECFERACQLNPRLGVAWFFAGLTKVQLGRDAEGLADLKRAEREGQAPPLVAEAQGDAYYNLRDFDTARRCYRRARERFEGNVALASKLGLVEVRAGNVEAGLKRLRRALTQEPKRAELYDRLIVAHVWLGQLDEAAAVVERKLEVTGPHPDSFLKLASIRAQQGDWRQAGCALRAGLHYSPDLEKLRLALAEVQAHESSQASL